MLAPSAPQKRILALIESDVTGFLSDAPVADAPGIPEIRKFLRENFDIYNKFGHILPVAAFEGSPAFAETGRMCPNLFYKSRFSRKNFRISDIPGRSPTGASVRKTLTSDSMRAKMRF